MSKFSKKPISEWEWGNEYEHYIDNLSLSDVVSLEKEFFTPDMTRAFDELYYALLDLKALRKKYLEQFVVYADDESLSIKENKALEEKWLQEEIQ